MSTNEKPISTKELEEIPSAIRRVLNSNRDNLEDNIELVILLLEKIGYSPKDVLIHEGTYTGYNLEQAISARRILFEKK